jgi:hypothetical protein
MLVPKHVVEQWYRTSHPIYKSFRFIFDNQLWRSTVPSGFSVCPYFWLAILSFIFLRPFVYFIHYIVLPVMKLFGRPGRGLDRLLQRGFRLLFPDYPDVVGAGFGALAITLVALLVGLVAWVKILGPAFEGVQKRGTAFGYFVYFEMLALVAISILVSYFRYRFEGRCRAQAWFLVWAATLLAGLLILSPGMFLTLLWLAGAMLYKLFSTIAWAIGIGIYYVGFGIVWTAEALWSFLTYKLWFGLPWVLLSLAGPLLMGGFIYLITMIVPESWMESSARKADRNLPPDDSRQYRIEDWNRLLVWLVNTSRAHDVCAKQAGYLSFPEPRFEKMADYTWLGFSMAISLLVKMTTVQIFADEIRRMVDMKIETPRGLWFAFMTTSSISERLSHVDKLLGPESGVSLFSVWRNSSQLSEMQIAVKSPEFSTEFTKIEKTAAALEKLRVAREESQWRKACINFSDMIIDRSAAFGVMLWNGVTAPFRFGWWLVRQIGIFFRYLGLLIKAKKQGACPYFRFEKDDSATA